MDSPQTGGFVEGQHEIKSPAWCVKTTDGRLVNPLDCHTTAKMMSYEDAFHKKRIISSSCEVEIWS